MSVLTGAHSAFARIAITSAYRTNNKLRLYVQSEIVSLTRDIPTGLGWMVGPFITSIPKDTLSFTLEATRKAVLAQIKQNAAAAR